MSTPQIAPNLPINPADITSKQIAEVIYRRSKVNLSSTYNQQKALSKLSKEFCFTVISPENELQISGELTNFRNIIKGFGLAKRFLGQNLTRFERQSFEVKVACLKKRLADLIEKYNINDTDKSILDKFDEADFDLLDFLENKNVESFGMRSIKRLIRRVEKDIGYNAVLETNEGLRVSKNFDSYLKILISQNAIRFKLSLVDPSEDRDLFTYLSSLQVKADELFNRFIEIDPVIKAFHFAGPVERTLIRKGIRAVLLSQVYELVNK